MHQRAEYCLNRFATLFVVICMVLLTAAVSRSQTEAVPGKDDFIDVEVEPRPITKIESLVVYPEEAKRLGIEGEVILAALIGTDGRVERVDVEQSGGLLLDSSAKHALEQARFTPAIASGKPIRIWFTVPIKFKLLKGGESERESTQTSRQEGSNAATPLSNIMDKVQYPAEAKQKGLEGKAVVSALIAADGSVEKTIIEESTDKIFEAAAMDAVKNTRFKPSLEDGKPVRSWFTIPIVFKLSQH